MSHNIDKMNELKRREYYIKKCQLNRTGTYASYNSERTLEELTQKAQKMMSRKNKNGKEFHNLGVLAALEISSKSKEKDTQKLIDSITKELIANWLISNNLDKELLNNVSFNEGVERAKRIIKLEMPERINDELEKLAKDNNLTIFLEENEQAQLSKEIILLAEKCAQEGHDISKLGSISENEMFLKAYNEAINNPSVPSKSRH